VKLDVIRQRICGALCAIAGALINAPAAVPTPSLSTLRRSIL
jgi:hypothetical protein